MFAACCMRWRFSQRGTSDEGGVALAAIQGVSQKLEAEDKEKDAQIKALQTQNKALEQRLDELEIIVSQKLKK